MDDVLDTDLVRVGDDILGVVKVVSKVAVPKVVKAYKMVDFICDDMIQALSLLTYFGQLLCQLIIVIALVALFIFIFLVRVFLGPLSFSLFHFLCFWLLSIVF